MIGENIMAKHTIIASKLIALLVIGCSSAAEEQPECSKEYKDCKEQYTASIVCLNGSCSCTVPDTGEAKFYECNTGEPDGLHNKSLGLP
jgi:hypothetical protein